MEVTPHHKQKSADNNTTADCAPNVKKSRTEAVRKLKAACEEAAKAAAASSGSGSSNIFKPPAPPCPTPPKQNPPPNRGVSLLSSKEGAVSDAHPLPSPSGRYNSIIINREIKYSQAVLGGELFWAEIGLWEFLFSGRLQDPPGRCP
jgi:hypothetical protein